MSRNHGISIRRTALVGLFALGLTTSVLAQSTAPSTGLGQSWPSAQDVSSSPNWHVYVFVLNGIKYIQINDLVGTVHAAVGTANGETIVLPVGVDAPRVSTAKVAVTSTTSSAASATVVVYSDSTTTLTATPLSNSTTQFVATPALEQTCGSSYGCTGGNVVSGP